MGESDSFLQNRVPWSSEPSLKEMAGEVKVDVDSFIEGIKNDKTDEEIAADLGVSENLIYHLRDRFYSHGIDSVMGQD
ncbi:MAG: helix-turn-helix domain containing protein [Desulfotomaculaceae bacterium]|nr:helix-turn-helix domain containing protein [Desulfotomaculaceae bacterium]MDD4767301.1 helix-turn-helix domain containing protein [Desulfotomaculaceae bacterium]